MGKSGEAIARCFEGIAINGVLAKINLITVYGGVVRLLEVDSGLCYEGAFVVLD